MAKQPRGGVGVRAGHGQSRPGPPVGHAGLNRGSRRRGLPPQRSGCLRSRLASGERPGARTPAGMCGRPFRVPVGAPLSWGVLCSAGSCGRPRSCPAAGQQDGQRERARGAPRPRGATGQGDRPQASPCSQACDRWPPGRKPAGGTDVPASQAWPSSCAWGRVWRRPHGWHDGVGRGVGCTADAGPANSEVEILRSLRGHSHQPPAGFPRGPLWGEPQRPARLSRLRAALLGRVVLSFETEPQTRDKSGAHAGNPLGLTEIRQQNVGRSRAAPTASDWAGAASGRTGCCQPPMRHS